MRFKAEGQRTRRIVNATRRERAALNTFVVARSRGKIPGRPEARVGKAL
jgi:hypothetical protein